MGEIALDRSTGYFPEDELIQLAEAPDGVAAGVADIQAPSTLLCVSAVVSAASAISAAWGDGCPTTACTSRC